MKIKLSRQSLAWAASILGAMVLDSARDDADDFAGPFGRDLKNDTGEQAAFARSLEYIRTTAYEVKYPPNQGREFIPRASDVPPGADTITWRVWDEAGFADYVSDFADDIPEVEMRGREESTKVKPLAVAYSYSFADLRKAQFMGTNLDADKARNARRAYDNKFEESIAFGYAPLNVPGFLTNDNATLILPADSAYVGGWSGSTDPADLLADMHYVWAKSEILTNDTLPPTTMLLAPVDFKLISTTRVSDLTETTVLEAFLKAHPGAEVKPWNLLKTADVAGTGRRGVVYRKDPEVLEYFEPLAFTQHAPEYRNLKIRTVCEGTTGGTVIHHPLAVTFFDMV